MGTQSYPNKIPIVCPCGASYIHSSSKYRHQKSNKHQKYEYNISRGIITINK